ncbi:hypothetical protein JCM3774_001266 [Rhodotorula dairenensis]
MGQSRTEQSIWSSESSARAQRRRQKVTDALIAARWLPTLAYLDVGDPDEASVVALVHSSTTAPQNLPRVDQSIREPTPSPPRRRPALFRYLSLSSASKVAVAPAGPAEPAVSSDSPPPYESLSRVPSSEPDSRSSPRARLNLTHHEHSSTWFSASSPGLDADAAVATPSQMPCRVQRAASAASADSGYASLFAVRSRTDPSNTHGTSQSQADGSGTAPPPHRKRCFSILPRRNSDPAGTCSEAAPRIENGEG